MAAHTTGIGTGMTGVLVALVNHFQVIRRQPVLQTLLHLIGHCTGGVHQDSGFSAGRWRAM